MCKARYSTDEIFIGYKKIDYSGTRFQFFGELSLYDTKVFRRREVFFSVRNWSNKIFMESFESYVVFFISEHRWSKKNNEKLSSFNLKKLNVFVKNFNVFIETFFGMLSSTLGTNIFYFILGYWNESQFFITFFRFFHPSIGLTPPHTVFSWILVSAGEKPQHNHYTPPSTNFKGFSYTLTETFHDKSYF